MKSNNVFYTGLFSICVILLIAGGCNKQSTPEPKTPAKAEQPKVIDAAPAPVPAIPDVIVEVNGEKFTREMAEGELEPRLASIRAQAPPDRIQEIKLRMIDQLVERFVVKTLLMGEAKKANLTASPEEIDQRLNKFKSSMPKGVTFEEIIKKNGITEAKVREDIGSDVMINKLFVPVTNGITVTEAETTEYMEKNKETLAFPESVHARHILVGVAKTDDEKAKAEKKSKIDKIKDQLDKGADFAALAKENSDCPSKEMGGDLGRFRKGQMTKPFEDAAFAQATNVVGSVVETEFGYHLIQVIEHQQAGTASKEDVSKVLMGQKCDEALRKYVSSLAQKANIKNNMPQRMMEPPMGMPGAGGQAPVPSPAPKR